METNTETILTLVQQLPVTTDVALLRGMASSLDQQLAQISPDELSRLRAALASRNGPPRDLPSIFAEAKKVFLELVTYALVIATESLFICIWACAIWGVTEILEKIEPYMPSWAPWMFKYVEIAFALFILAKLFIGRAEVFEEAVRRGNRVLTSWRHSNSTTSRTPP